MAKAYLVYYIEPCNGSPEDCNIFYCEPEVWLDKDLAKQRIADLEANKPSDKWGTLLVPAELKP